MQKLYSDVQTRDVTIDIIKALGIICMVAGHCGSPITKFIYLFHMAIFFIASGYFFSPEKSDGFANLLGFIKRKFITLWFPYLLWTTIYSCLHNFFITINVYTDNPVLLEYVKGTRIATTQPWTITDIVINILKAFLLHGGTQMGGAMWFVITLMEISITYCVIDFFIKRVLKVNNTLKMQIIISVIFLGLGYWCYLTGFSFAGIDKVLSYYFLFHGGFLIKQHGISNRAMTEFKHCIIFTISFIILLICNKIGEISLNINSYENPIFFLIVSFVGWQFLYEIAYFVKKIIPLKNLMVCIGQNTMAVVILHFLCFKIVSYIGVLVKGEPLCLVAAYPILYSGGFWWVFYLAVGLGVPVFLSIAWKKVVNFRTQPSDRLVPHNSCTRRYNR